MKKFLVVILMVGLFALCAQATPNLSLIPSSGTVSGSPAATVGWGFTLQNDDPNDWLVLNDSYFTPSNTLGFDSTYTDLIASQFVIVDPGSSTGPQWYDPNAPTGIGSLTLPSTAPEGQYAMGTIFLDYSVFSQDPNDPNFDPNSFVGTGLLSADANVQVPEPSSAMMLLGAAPLLLGTVRRKLWR